MAPLEFESWRAFYERWPFDDRARFHRPAAMLAGAASQGTVEIDDALDWLDRKPPPDALFNEHERAMFKAAGVSPPRRE